MGIQEHRLGGQIAGISFSKTLVCGEVKVHSVDLPHSDVGRQVMIIHLGEVVCCGSCRVPGMGLLPSSRVFFPSAVVKGWLSSLLVSGGFMLHSRISPQTGLFCSNRLHPIQKTSDNLSLLPLPDVSRNCPMGLDLTVQDPTCGRDFPMRGSPEGWWEAPVFTSEA